MSSVRSWEGDLPTPDSLGFDWRRDPYSIDAQLTDHYMDLYFTRINAGTYGMFPREPFRYWLRKTTDKSPADLVLIYTMLAVGSIFSSRAGREEEGGRLARIAQHGVEKHQGRYTLQLTQSRTILALYHLATGDSEKAWDYCGLASRAAAGLKLHLKEDITNRNEYETHEYGLNEHGLAECRRRTFWSVYLIDVSISRSH